MEKELNSTSIKPPSIIPAFVAGFNAIANHIYLILFPVLLDIFLWFGPLVRVKNLVQPVFDNTIKQMTSVYPADTLALMQTSKDAIMQFFEQFNLFFFLRSYPVGVPSLLVGTAPLNNPIGKIMIKELTSGRDVTLVVIACLIVGITLGAVLFSLIARLVGSQKEPLNPDRLITQGKNTLIFFLLMVVLGISIALPSLFILSAIIVFLPGLGSIPFMILGIVLVWMLLPFSFSAHGIFSGQTNVFSSVGTSIRLVRKYLPGTGLFFLLAILLSQGLDMLWATPASSDWLGLVGILGHGFISCGVLAASFVYYSRGMEYMQDKIRRDSAKTELPVRGGN
jgi:hypothetical protein